MREFLKKQVPMSVILIAGAMIMIGQVGLCAQLPCSTCDQLTLTSERPAILLEDSTTNEDDFEIAVNDNNFAVAKAGVLNLLVIQSAGNVGIGTQVPQTKLHVVGVVRATGYETGDIVFEKDGHKLWRMFEDERGLHLENLKTGEASKVFLEKDLEEWTNLVQEQQKTIQEQQRNILALVEKVKILEERGQKPEK